MSVISAIYGRPQLPEYTNNPVLLALPHFVLAEDYAEQFPRLPLIGTRDRSLSKATRMLAVSRIYNYLELLPPHWDVMDTLGMMIRAGYVPRNPINTEYQKALVTFYRQSQEEKIATIVTTGPSTAPSCALFGTSGVGKTSVVERYLSFLPQVICHEQHGFIQLVWLKLDCPLDGSLKGLLFSFLIKVDELIGTRYSTLVNANSTVDTILLQMVKVAASHHLGLLVIDEIQHVLDAAGVSQAKMLNFFVTLSNNAKIPLLTMGTAKALELLQGTFRAARRVGDSGCFIWTQLSRGEEWDFFVESLFEYQWTTKKAIFSHELSKVIFDCTQGIHGLVVRLFQMSQIRAIQADSARITSAIVREVAKEKLQLVQPMLNALKDNNAEEMNKYDDLIRTNLISLDQKIDTAARLDISKEYKASTNKQISDRIRAVSFLVGINIDEMLARKLVDDKLSKNPNLTAAKIVAHIMQEEIPTVTKKNSKAAMKKILSESIPA